MMMAGGAVVGWSGLIVFLFLASVTGVVFGLVMISARRLDAGRLKHYARCLFDWRYDRRAGREELPSPESEATRIPFAVPVAIALVATHTFLFF